MVLDLTLPLCVSRTSFTVAVEDCSKVNLFLPDPFEGVCGRGPSCGELSLEVPDQPSLEVPGAPPLMELKSQEVPLVFGELWLLLHVLI